MDTVHLDAGYKYARVFVFVQHNANDPTPSHSLNYWSKVSRVYLFSQRVGCPPVAPDYEKARLIPYYVNHTGIDESLRVVLLTGV